MSIAAKLRRAPLRVTTGGFILNSGLGKVTNTDEDAAKAIHGLAAGAYPQLERINPRTFQKLVGAGEVALGGALLLPIFPAGLVGLGLMGFSGALLGVYWRTPGMHEEGSIRPTHQGIAIAKDSWMFGAGAALVLDAFFQGAHDLRKDKAPSSDETRAAVAAGAASAAGAVGSWLNKAKTATAEGTHHAVEVAKTAKDEHGPQVAAALSTAGSVLADKAASAVEAAKTAKDEHGPQVAAALSSVGATVAEKATDAADSARDAKDQHSGTVAKALQTAGAVIAERAAVAGSVIADKAADAGSVISDKASDAGSAVADRAPSSGQVQNVWEHARARAVERASAAVDASRDKGSDAASSARKAAKSYRKSAKRSAKDLRKAARTSGKDLRASAQDYGKSFRKEAKKSAAAARESAQDLRESAKHAVAAAKK